MGCCTVKFRGKPVTCLSLGMWLIASPWGQFTLLCILTIPLGVWSIITASDSYNDLNVAVDQFGLIIGNWQTRPFSTVSVVNASESCSSRRGDGWEEYSTVDWDGADNAPCACPDSTYQPFGTATSSELVQGMQDVWGQEGTQTVGFWKSSKCTTSRSLEGTYNSISAFTNMNNIPHCTDQTYTGSCIQSSSSGASSNLCGGQTQCYTYTTQTTTNDSRRRQGTDSRRRRNGSGYGDGGRRVKDESKKEASTQLENLRRQCTESTSGSTETCQTYTFYVYSSTCYNIAKQSSAAGKCGEDQDTMLCVAPYKLSKMALSAWRNKKICVKRDGTPALDGDLKERPIPSSGSCPSGYTMCGTGDYNTKKTMCVPTGELCPISKLQIASSDYASNSNSSWSGSIPMGGGMYLMFARAGVAQDLPIAATWYGINKKCIITGNPKFSKGQYNGDKSSVSWTQTYSHQSGCTNYDTRYTQVDSYVATEFLQQNLAVGCGTSTLSWSANKSPSSTGESLYGVSSLNTTNSDYCSSGDALCAAILDSTECERKQLYASSSVNDDFTMNMANIGEIYYKVDDSCASKHQLADAQDEVEGLRSIVKLQLNLLISATVINVLLTLIAIVVDCSAMDDYQHSGATCHQIWMHRCVTIVGLGFIIGKIVTITLAYLHVLAAEGVFVNADKCTDSVSATMGFEEISSTIHSVKSNTILNYIIEIVLIAYDIYSVITARAFKEDDLKEADESTAAV